MTLHTEKLDKEYWTSKHGNCEEQVRLFYSKQSSTVDRK